MFPSLGTNPQKASGKGVMALKKNIVGNIAGLKAKIKESQGSDYLSSQ